MAKMEFSYIVIVLQLSFLSAMASVSFPAKLNGVNGLIAYCGTTGMVLLDTYELKTSQVSTYEDCAAACDNEGSSCDSFNINVNVPNHGDIQCVLNKPSGGASPFCATSDSAWYSTDNCGSNRLVPTCCDYNVNCGLYGPSECKINIPWMNWNCPGTCKNSYTCALEYNGYAADTDFNCLEWASEEECEINPDWMLVYCASSCAKRADSITCDLNTRPDFNTNTIWLDETYPASSGYPPLWPYSFSVFCLNDPEGTELNRGLTTCHTNGTWLTSPWPIGDDPPCV